MRYRITQRKKPELSPHQKEIRFLAGLAVFISFLLTVGILWLANSAKFLPH